MAQQRVDNIQINAPKDIDNKKGVWANGTWRPYNNTAEAIATLSVGERYQTLPVVIFKSGIPTDYWWRDGVSDGQLIEKTSGGSSYTLPIATSSVLGGIRIGSGLEIDPSTGIVNVTGGGGGSGTVTSVSMTSTDFDITGSPIKTSGTLIANIKNSAVTFAKMQSVAQGSLVGRGAVGTGVLSVVTIGAGLALSTGNVLSATGGGSYELPIATASVLGGVKVGSGLSINATTGVLSATGGGTGTVTSLTAGNGMAFSTITTSGTVTMGTPSTVSASTSNVASAGTHTHALDLSTLINLTLSGILQAHTGKFTNKLEIPEKSGGTPTPTGNVWEMYVLI